MSNPVKIIIAVLFALAVLFGLSRSDVKLFGLDRHNNTELAASGDQSLESFFQKSKQIETPKTTTATFLAVGDIMLSRNVAGSMAKANNPLLPFSQLKDLLRSTDFNFGNLESPLSGRSDYNPTGSLVFNAPPAYAVGLKEYNFQMLNLANNHALDQGEAGVSYTEKFLDENGLSHIGTGKNLDQAWQGKVITINGIKIGFVGASYSSLNDGGKATNNFVARIEDVARLKKSIENLKQQADFVVVTMHAGTEYTREPNEPQVALAHAAIDAGADIVIGAHPHWVQTTEQYKGKYIFYSLGNFIFDQMFSQDTREGLTLKITLESSKTGNATTPRAATVDDLQGQRLGATIKQIELIPIIIDNYSTPRLATDTEAENILKKINLEQKIIVP
jgi:poly-gamma-glutamate capsule biosynthesis protein CapA/YwtB (metallophosphatase superfamily)